MSCPRMLPPFHKEFDSILGRKMTVTPRWTHKLQITYLGEWKRSHPISLLGWIETMMATGILKSNQKKPKARIYQTHRPRNGTTLLHGPRKIYMPNSVTIRLRTKPSSDTWCGHQALANRRVPASPQSFNSTQACAVDTAYWTFSLFWTWTQCFLFSDPSSAFPCGWTLEICCLVSPQQLQQQFLQTHWAASFLPIRLCLSPALKPLELDSCPLSFVFIPQKASMLVGT